ncbi:hypothetical protein DRN46_00495 [Thermococci archaeon]|nr:MAG: hypothetical protein DRN46_00495 [Thermococci archaeon]
MIIVGADSGTSLLNERFQGDGPFVTCAVKVEAPYNTPCKVMYKKARKRRVIEGEIELALKLAREEGADEVHLDIPGGRLSRKKGDVPLISEIRDFESETGIRVLGLGKLSLAVRLAEISTATYSIVLLSDQEERGKFSLGLPKGVRTIVKDEREVESKSMYPWEDLRVKAVLRRSVVHSVIYQNPVLRGYWVLDITF